MAKLSLYCQLLSDQVWNLGFLRVQIETLDHRYLYIYGYRQLRLTW